MNFETVLKKIKSLKKPSEEQSAVGRWLWEGTGCARIVAVAGSGKTTALVFLAEVLAHLDPSLTCLVLVFGRPNADEMAPKFKKVRPYKTITGTFHSIGFGAYRRWAQGSGIRNVQIDKQKVYRIIDHMFETGVINEFEKRAYSMFAKRLIGLAKSAGVTHLVPDENQIWIDFCEVHDVDVEEEGATRERGIEIAREVLRRNNEMLNVVDFDDMLYMPLIHNCSFFKNDIVMGDEWQDTNAVQRALVARMLKKGGRLIVVGDPHQAIYFFRGATADAMDISAEKYNMDLFGLTYSFRCPKAVVRYVQQYVSHIKAHPKAIEGAVSHFTVDKTGKAILRDYFEPEKTRVFEGFKPTDTILCRNGAPIIELAYRFIRMGIGCRILGRDIGEGLKSLVKKLNAKDIDELIVKLEKWYKRESEAALSKGDEGKVNRLEDKFLSLKSIMDHLNEDSRTIDGLNNQIDNLFDDATNGGILTLCTAHKAKGKEWDRVFIYRPELMPSKWARSKVQLEQEKNLQYVAGTRAKNELVLLPEKFQLSE